MSEQLASIISNNARELAMHLSWTDERLFKSAREPWADAPGGTWIDAMFRRFRDDGKVRREVFREALLALAAHVGRAADDDGLDSLSDWLRNGCYLYATLPAGRLPQARLLFAEVLEKFVGRCVAAGRTPGGSAAGFKAALSSAVGSLFAELPQAIECFEHLRRLNDALPGGTHAATEIERYWDASARLSPMFTIDWACFDRPELFDHNGRRAAEWLVNNGFVDCSSTVLEIGCGMGRVGRHLAPRARHVYGVDISERMIELASGWMAGCDNVTVFKTDGRRLPLADESVDTVFAFMVFLDVKNPALWQDLLAEASRVLRPGGRFIFTLDIETFTRTYDGIERLGGRSGLERLKVGRVDSRSLNSFRFEWDMVYQFRKSAAALRVGGLAARH